MDLISIIIPYYKKRKYIKSTLISILNQSYRKFEILIIYDDSSIEDLEFLKNLIKIDPRIKLIKNNKNIGAGLSRNKGLKFSRGNYICFIDADDVWKKNKLKHQLNFMKKNNYLVSHTSYNIFNKKNEITQIRKAKNFFNLKDLVTSCDVGLSTVMIKKSIISKNIKFSKTKTKEDFILWLKIIKKGIPIHGLDMPLTNWRSLEDSLSSSNFQKLKDGYVVYRFYLNYGHIKSLFYLFLLSINFLVKSYKSKANV
ncbi:glycosyltransferase family 2 protein [Candidatus Pelagibacter communis]|uniref:glycosyltransferase family 2 protein n=1 Tax=Candidatus Pelagibacter TaxID=198251 RepID=UPI003EE004CA